MDFLRVNQREAWWSSEGTRKRKSRKTFHVISPTWEMGQGKRETGQGAEKLWARLFFIGHTLATQRHFLTG